LTLQFCSAAEHDRDISSFLESHFVGFCFTTAHKWKEPHCTGSQGIGFLLTPSSKCFRQQDRTDRLVCQSLKSVAPFRCRHSVQHSRHLLQRPLVVVSCLQPDLNLIPACLLPAASWGVLSLPSGLSCVSREVGPEPR